MSWQYKPAFYRRLESWNWVDADGMVWGTVTLINKHPKLFAAHIVHRNRAGEFLLRKHLTNTTSITTARELVEGGAL